MHLRAALLLLALSPRLLAAQRPAPTPASRPAALDTAFLKVPSWRFVGGVLAALGIVLGIIAVLRPLGASLAP